MASLHVQCLISHDFLLKRFGREPLPACLAVTGAIYRYAKAVAVVFKVAGDIEHVRIPPRNQVVERRDELWRTTCFECFLGRTNSSRYWEFNISPSGHWNVYAFSAYRTGMVAEHMFRDVTSTAHREQDAYWLHCSLELPHLVREEQQLQAGVSCVLEHADGTRSYWALCHPAKKADFHHRDSFILEI